MPRRFVTGAICRPEAASAGLWQNRLRQLADALETIRFAAPPVLTCAFFGDARDLQSFDVRLALAASGAAHPGAPSAGAAWMSASFRQHQRSRFVLN